MIYRARRVLPMDGPVIENGEVLVSDGGIAAVGKELAASYPDEPARDLGDCALMPGFVNAHCHVDYTLSRNAVDALNFWDWIDKVGFNRDHLPEYDTFLRSAKQGLRELLCSGVTCVGDSTYSGAAAEAMAKLGLRGIAYREVFGQSMGQDCAARFAAALEEVEKLQARMPDRVRIGISPHAIYSSNRGLLEMCANACREQGLRIAMHLAECSAETDYSVDGTGPIADWRRKIGYEPMVTGTTPARYLADVGLLQPGVCLAHCVHLDEEEIALIAASGASVAHCPRSNAYLGAGVAPVPHIMQAGGIVGLATDSAGSCIRLDFFEEMRFTLGVHRAIAQEASVLTAKQVLEMATIGGARALGLGESIGTIAPGKRGDLIAISLAEVGPDEDIHLAIIARSPADVVMAMVDGVELGKAAN